MSGYGLSRVRLAEHLGNIFRNKVRFAIVADDRADRGVVDPKQHWRSSRDPIRWGQQLLPLLKTQDIYVGFTTSS